MAAPEPGTERRARRLTPFWRHCVEMLAAMVVGMVAAAALFEVIVRAASWEQILTDYPTQALLAMAAGMTVPMAAWMLHRGMGRRITAEMSAVVVVTALPSLCLVWLAVTDSAPCGGYCLLSVVAMLVLMRYRHDEYAGEHPVHGPAPAKQPDRDPHLVA